MAELNGGTTFWNAMNTCLYTNRTQSLSFADRMSHCSCSLGLTKQWVYLSLKSCHLSQPWRMLRKLHVALRDIWRAWQQRCLNKSSKDGKFWKWEYCFPTMFFIARSQNGYGSNMPTSQTNINRRYPQIITMQSCNPSADPGAPKQGVVGPFFDFYLLNLETLGLTNCTVSTSMSICKLFHHHWKFRRYPVFRLLAKQKGSSSANLIDCSEEKLRDRWEHSVTLGVFWRIVKLTRVLSYSNAWKLLVSSSGGLLVCTLKSNLQFDGHPNVARRMARPSRTHFLLIIDNSDSPGGIAPQFGGMQWYPMIWKTRYCNSCRWRQSKSHEWFKDSRPSATVDASEIPNNQRFRM